MTRSTLSMWLLATFTIACSQNVAEEEIRHYPIDDMQEIIAESGVRIDKEISSDGNGSLHIAAESPTTIQLYETGDIDVEAARLIYRARLRTESIEGQVYLEMWCRFPEKGEYFSRALQSPLTGTQDWTIQETPFFLRQGDNPDNVRLNLVVTGSGNVWIDDIHLLKAPLP
ncbi:MAG TPA: hypothetical protein VLV83_26830 [Acidobacteriota bacterium]|nr:hypothetical protein [Acidobacteriota bacterium]